MSTSTSRTTREPAPPLVTTRPISERGFGLPTLIPLRFSEHETAIPGLERRLQFFADASRWATLTLGIVVGVITGPIDGRFLTVCAALVCSAATFHAQPVALSPPGERAHVRVGLELTLTLVALAATGGATSPFVLTPMTVLVLAGYIWGDRVAVAATLSIGVGLAAAVASEFGHGDAATSAAIGLIYLLCGMLGAFGRSLLTQVEEQRAATLDQATQLSTANQLLVALHGLAQTLPASFDLGDVVSSTKHRLGVLLEYETLVILARDDTGNQWTVELADGARLGSLIELDDLAGPLKRAANALHPIVIDDLLADGERGCASLTRSGLYGALRARGSIVGLIAVEHSAPRFYKDRDAQLLENIAPLVALAIDNAKWFRRLRMFGAEAERARIARDLHDRIAQSLAYVAFELERLTDADPAYAAELASLHDVVRSIVSGLRETLYELRASITADHDIEAAARERLTRLSERTGIRTHWEQQAARRLPLQLEQEVWRIMQEALTNVERHAQAHNVSVSWTVTDRGAVLQVRDDGCGFDAGRVERDHYGLVGMRERADAIRARLNIDTRPGRGTTLSLRVEDQS